MRNSSSQLDPTSYEVPDKSDLEVFGEGFSVIQVGRVGGWSYLVTLFKRESRFHVVRRDIKYDQVEDEIGVARSFEEAEGVARNAMERERRLRRSLGIEWED